MLTPTPLRPELASVWRYLKREPEMAVMREAPRAGILALLASGRGLQ
jgi:hypothetical protein